ncbi:MAG: exonuclease domain-containing protein [Pseudomonadota bacterium]
MTEFINQTLRVPRRRGARDLPTFYYRTHFLEMLEFVGLHYAHVLSDSQLAFRRDFLALSFAAQCLYVRMVNRKGTLFARQRLRYAEIPNIGATLGELDAAGFLERARIEHSEEMLQFMTRSQLSQTLKAHVPGLKGNLKKAELVEIAREQTPVDGLFASLPTTAVVVQGRSSDVRFLLFLFFGRIQDGLTQFTMRDLGLVRASDSRELYEPRFTDREDAVAACYFAERLHRLQQNETTATRLAIEVNGWPTPQSCIAADLREQLAFELGRALEPDPPTALRIYRLGESARCSERIVRLLLASGERDEAQRFLRRCIERPVSDEEALLASDLYARKFGKKRTSALTDRLRSAEVIELDEAHRGVPEKAAAEWFRAQGAQAFRVENGLWRTLFGLLFWDVLFDGDAAGTHSPFERLPSVLTERRFLLEHETVIDKRLLLLNDPVLLKRRLLKVGAAHYGAPNGIFRWRQSILDALHALIAVAPADGLKEMMMLFCDHYLAARHGYPDLMVIDNEGVRFVEIKSDGDQLRRNQLLRIEQLQRAGFRADVVNVRWTLTPTQAYVVVDVETTGGRGEQHRVTEIGAVKVIDGKIVDTFQTLLNPQRNIPRGITRLTGITPEMVADAPVFADVADRFAKFLSGGIFVAHNVEFDYRFIGQEFRRLGRSFRMPKLCTCASMRKLYPGHRSYSLARLSERYDIPLTSHHRALCDAEAAAQLLIMINAKRQENLRAGANH